MSSSITHVTKWHPQCNNTHHHTLYTGRGTQGKLSQFSPSISPILDQWLVIFATKFYFRTWISLHKLSTNNNHVTMSLSSTYNHHALSLVISSICFTQAFIHVIYTFMFMYIFMLMCFCPRCSWCNSYIIVFFYVNKVNHVDYLSSYSGLFKHDSYH